MSPGDGTDAHEVSGGDAVCQQREKSQAGPSQPHAPPCLASRGRRVRATAARVCRVGWGRRHAHPRLPTWADFPAHKEQADATRQILYANACKLCLVAIAVQETEARTGPKAVGAPLLTLTPRVLVCKVGSTDGGDSCERDTCVPQAASARHTCRA